MPSAIASRPCGWPRHPRRDGRRHRSAGSRRQSLPQEPDQSQRAPPFASSLPRTTLERSASRAEPIIAGKCRHPHPLMRDARHDNAAPAAGHAELCGFRPPALKVELRPRKSVSAPAPSRPRVSESSRPSRRCPGRRKRSRADSRENERHRRASARYRRARRGSRRSSVGNVYQPELAAPTASKMPCGCVANSRWTNCPPAE